MSNMDYFDKNSQLTDSQQKRKKRAVLIIAIFLTVLLILPFVAFFCTKAFLKSTYEYNEKERIIQGMKLRYNEDFEYYLIYDNGTWLDQFEKQDTRKAVVKNKKYSDEPIYITFNRDRYLKNPEKWDDSFIAVKYKESVKDRITDIAKKYYGDNIYIILTSDVILPTEDFPSDMTYEEFVKADGVKLSYGIYINTEKDANNTENDFIGFAKEMKKNGFDVSFNVYYYDKIPLFSGIPNDLTGVGNINCVAKGHYEAGERKMSWQIRDENNQMQFADDTIISFD